MASSSLFGKLARPHFETPANAVLLHTALALIVLSFGAFDHILAYIIFSAICFLALSVTRAATQGQSESGGSPPRPSSSSSDAPSSIS